MKQTLCILLVTVATFFAQQPGNPPSNAVPDEATAVKIAEKALTRIYGKKIIESERPFTATLTNGVWHVGGTLYCSDEHGNTSTSPCAGGVAMAEVKQSNGRILKTGHTK
jgi:hypothetical protein